MTCIDASLPSGAIDPRPTSIIHGTVGMSMTDASDSILDRYDYDLPPELVAQAPAEPRDSARLLVYDRGTDEVSLSTFARITDELPHNAVLVFNRTKVIPARMRLTKETGGSVEALYLGDARGGVRVMASGKIAEGDVLAWKDGHSFTVAERDGKEARLDPSFPPHRLHELLEAYGETPLPPYIKHSPLDEPARRREYQTVYARDEGSVAAPTAGLHFTPELLDRIEEHGCDIAYVTLHVNLGTFAPITEDDVRRKRLHKEAYSIDPATADMLNRAKAEDRPIIAVGTTTVRTLESAAVLPEDQDVPRLEYLRGVTDIFLTEDDLPLFTDGLITNFHVPRSSLLMLVSAFTGRDKLMDLYARAKNEQMRFFSFGDGMLIL